MSDNTWANTESGSSTQQPQPEERRVDEAEDMVQGSSEWWERSDGIVERLNREWRALVRADQEDSHGPVTQRWSRQSPVFAECQDLEDVLSAITLSPDPVLAALLAEHHGGSELAGRAVLQTMLGKLITMASKDRSASIDDYVAQLWLGIKTYPLDRRRHHIAANLALDTLKAVVAEDPARRAKIRLVLMSSDLVLDQAKRQEHRRLTLDHNASGRLTADRAIADAWALGLIDQRGRDVLLSVYAEDLSGRHAAIRHQMSCVMVRYVCSRTVRQLAAHQDQLLAAAQDQLLRSARDQLPESARNHMLAAA